MNTLQAVTRRLRGKYRKGVFRPERSRDIYLASYPRSGNTWLRALAFLLEQKRLPRNLAEIDYFVPDLHLELQIEKVASQPRYVVKTHDCYSSAVGRALYIIRDPVDVLESYFRYHAKVYSPAPSIEDFAIDAVSGRVWPCSWSEHVMSWTSPSREGVEALRYEDLVVRSEKAIIVLAQIFEIEEEEVLSALQALDKESMKSLEQKGNRKSLERAGNEWFVGGVASDANKDVIRKSIRVYRPEIADLAAKHGYDF